MPLEAKKKPRLKQAVQAVSTASSMRSKSVNLDDAPVNGDRASDRASRSNSVFDSANFLARQHAKRLEARRDRCVNQTEYKQAAKINGELKQVLEEHEVIETEKVQLKLMQEHLRMIVRQSEELQQFNANWATRMEKFGRRVAWIRGEFREDQKEARKEHIKEVRSQKPQLKFSKQLTFLKDQAHELARLEKYDEADFVKNEAAVFEQAEIFDFQHKCDLVSRLGGKETFIKAQKSNTDIFEQKIEADWLRLNVAKREETEVLLKRQANERSRFIKKMKRESIEVANLLQES